MSSKVSSRAPKVPVGSDLYEEDGRSEKRRGPWTLEEDNLLIQYVTRHGEGRWNSLAESAGLRRTGKSCRLRWLNYLKPDIRRGNLTPHEQLLILELHSQWGNRWSKIAQHLPGRTDNEIKNYWRTRVQKQARQMKVDSNSKKFVEAIRKFWKPRLLEKIKQANSNSSPSSSVETPIFTASSPDFDQHPLSPIPNNLVTREDLGTGKYNTESSSVLSTDECYHVDGLSGAYGRMMPEMSSQDFSLSGCHVAGADWFGDDFGESTFWETDELWQFKKLGI